MLRRSRSTSSPAIRLHRQQGFAGVLVKSNGPRRARPWWRRRRRSPCIHNPLSNHAQFRTPRPLSGHGPQRHGRHLAPGVHARSHQCAAGGRQRHGRRHRRVRRAGRGRTRLDRHWRRLLCALRAWRARRCAGLQWLGPRAGRGDARGAGASGRDRMDAPFGACGDRARRGRCLGDAGRRPWHAAAGRAAATRDRVGRAGLCGGAALRRRLGRECRAAAPGPGGRAHLSARRPGARRGRCPPLARARGHAARDCRRRARGVLPGHARRRHGRLPAGARRAAHGRGFRGVPR